MSNSHASTALSTIQPTPAPETSVPGRDPREDQVHAPRTLVFDPDRHRTHPRRLGVSKDVTRAMRSRELPLFFQPIYQLEDGRLSGFEALLRWNHPRLGLLTPDQFLSIIEAPCVAWDVDRYVFESACSVLHQWGQAERSDPAPYVSVNLSGTGITHPCLCEWVEDRLQAFGLNAQLLQVELTERVVVDDSVLANLSGLRELGVQIALDDFGTGYSTLTRLEEIPLDVVKIDRVFVSGDCTPHIARPREIAAAARVAAELGLRVVAEGINSRRQVIAASLLGCHDGQGHYFAPAVSSTAAESMVSDGWFVDRC